MRVHVQLSIEKGTWSNALRLFCDPSTRLIPSLPGGAVLRTFPESCEDEGIYRLVGVCAHIHILLGNLGGGLTNLKL